MKRFATHPPFFSTAADNGKFAKGRGGGEGEGRKGGGGKGDNKIGRKFFDSKNS